MKITKTQLRQIIRESLADDESITMNEEAVGIYWGEIKALTDKLRTMIYDHVKDEVGPASAAAREMSETLNHIYVASKKAIWHAKRIKR